MNANEAIAAAENRKVHLKNQLNLKKCSSPITPQATDNKVSEPTLITSSTPQSKEFKLAELKRLYNSDLISKEIYDERQKLILDSPSQ